MGGLVKTRFEKLLLRGNAQKEATKRFRENTGENTS
jgi:hypothetical protein